jgi:hypothetical protein
MFMKAWVGADTANKTASCLQGSGSSAGVQKARL